MEGEIRTKNIAMLEAFIDFFERNHKKASLEYDRIDEVVSRMTWAINGIRGLCVQGEHEDYTREYGKLLNLCKTEARKENVAVLEVDQDSTIWYYIKNVNLSFTFKNKESGKKYTNCTIAIADCEPGKWEMHFQHNNDAKWQVSNIEGGIGTKISIVQASIDAITSHKEIQETPPDFKELAPREKKRKSKESERSEKQDNIILPPSPISVREVSDLEVGVQKRQRTEEPNSNPGKPQETVVSPQALVTVKIKGGIIG